MLPYSSLLLLISISLSLPIFASSYKLPVTRDGVTKTRVAYNNWIGEYPIPVINVNAKKRGFTSISAYRSLRKLNQPVSCTIKNGLYHPWSKTKNSAVTYYSLVALASYRAKKNTKIEKQMIKKGDLIDNVHALGEGYCSGQLVSGRQKKSIEFDCGDVDPPTFQEKSDGNHFHEQWVYLSCRQGYKAFVQDKALLKEPGVTQGRITDYGDVAR